MPRPNPANPLMHPRPRAPRGLDLLARACLVVLFPPSGIDKIMHWDSALKQADSSIVPPAAGPPMVAAAAITELVAPVCIVTGRFDRSAAFVLAGFSTVTALLYHPFWQFPGFWSPRNKVGNAHLWDFLKNFGLIGGLLLVVLGRKRGARL